MPSENLKTLFLAAWMIAVALVAIALGTTTVTNWIVVACIAILPAVVVRRFWRDPDQTISESIHEARR